MPRGKRCKDCEAEGIETRRKAPHPGPRCVSHHRAVKKRRQTRTHQQHVAELYGLTYEQYWALYEHQGGVCNICRRATGAKRKLSVDHCHATGEVRQLLCVPCNRDVLGHLRDDVEALKRAADSIVNPPAREAIGQCFVPPAGAPTRPRKTGSR